MRSGKITTVILNRGCNHPDTAQHTDITNVNAGITSVNVNSHL